MTTFPQRMNRGQHRFSTSSERPGRAKSRHTSNPAQQPVWSNQALLRLLRTRTIQAKFKINEPGDKYEREADRVADQVIGLPVPTIQRPAMPSLIPKVAGTSTILDRVPPKVHDVLTSPGHPLDTTTRAFFEPRLGYDFSRVRVHIDSDAADSASSIHALAYTVNHHIVFGAGRFKPETKEGQHLLAHELSHIVQPKGQDQRHNAIQRRVDSSNFGPLIDCTKAITTDFSCYDLIAEMIRLRFDIRENDSWIKRYDSGEIPFDQQAYDLRKQIKIELQSKYDEKELIRLTCCRKHEVPEEAPTHVPAIVPEGTEPKPSSDK